MSLPSLPTEIVEQVVSNLANDTGTLLAFSLLCKTLCSIGQRRLFERVKIRLRKSRRLDAVLAANPKLIQYIKHLVLIHHIPNPRCKVLSDGSFRSMPSFRCDDPEITGILDKLSSSSILHSIQLFSSDYTTPIDWFSLKEAFRTALLGVLGVSSLRDLAILNVFNIPIDTLHRPSNLQTLTTQLPFFQRTIAAPIPAVAVGGMSPEGSALESAQEDAVIPGSGQGYGGPTSVQRHYPTTLNLHLSVDAATPDLDTFQSSIGLSRVERFSLTFGATSIDIPQLLSQLTAVKELYIGFSWIGTPKIDIQTLSHPPRPKYTSRPPLNYIADLGRILDTIPAPHPSLSCLGIILYSTSPNEIDIPIDRLKHLVNPLSRLHTTFGSILKTVEMVIGIPENYYEFDKVEENILATLYWDGCEEVLKIRAKVATNGAWWGR